MNRSGEPWRAGGRISRDRERRESPCRRIRSPRRDKEPQGKSPQPRFGREPGANPRPLSLAVFVGNRPMTDADSIVRDSSVAVKFGRQIFPPKVQQLMVGQQDFEVFREGIHDAVKGLYTAYEICMCFRATRQEIEKMDEHI